MINLAREEAMMTRAPMTEDEVAAGEALCAAISDEQASTGAIPHHIVSEMARSWPRALAEVRRLRDRIAWLSKTLECSQEAARAYRHTRDSLLENEKRLDAEVQRLQAENTELRRTIAAFRGPELPSAEWTVE